MHLMGADIQMAQPLRSRSLIAASILLAASFLLDLFTPLGFAGGVPYALAVLVAGSSNRPRHVIAISIAGALLTGLGFFISPTGSPIGIVAANRGLALLLILGAMTFVLHVHRGAIERERNRFFEESLDLLLIGGLDGYIRRANPALVDLLEYPKDRVLEIPYLDHVHPDDREETAAAIGAVARGEVVPSFCHRLITRGGAIRWIEWSAPAVLSKGDVFYAAGRDITERIEQEEQLHLAREFLGSAIDSLSSHICILDESGKIVLVNQKWRQFAIDNGGDETGYLGLDYFQASSPPGAEEDQAACEITAGIREVLTGRRASFYAEYSCHSPNEKWWFSCRVTSFVNGGRRWATVAHENVTERHLAEERQARYAEVIESTFRPRWSSSGVSPNA